MRSRSVWTGKGSWKDNVFVERLWKSVKYEEVYLRAYESVPEARTGLGRYFEFYNAGRPVKGGGILGHGAEQKYTSRSSVFSENVRLRWVSPGALSGSEAGGV